MNLSSKHKHIEDMDPKTVKQVLKKVGGKLETVLAPRFLELGELEDVIAIRDDEYGLRRATNIRWRVGAWHVNAGHEWGYSGAGPTDFARNVLFHFTQDEKFATEHEIEFRELFIKTLPEPGGRIKKEDILQFVKDKKKS